MLQVSQHAWEHLLLTLPGQAATVLSIGAGVTLGGEDRGKRLTIRLACIDAAEMAKNSYGAQSFRVSFEDGAFRSPRRAPNHLSSPLTLEPLRHPA